MKNTKKIVGLLSTLVFLNSCISQDKIAFEDLAQGITFFADDIKTRVADGRFELDDEIFVSAYHDGQPYQHAVYRYEGEETFGSDTPFTYSSEEPWSLSYIATYPKQYTDSVFNVVAASDQSTQEAFELSDVLVANTQATEAIKPTLTFFHVMSNLVIKLQVINAAGESIPYTDVKFKAILSQDCDPVQETYLMSSGAQAEEVIPLALSDDRFAMILAAGQTLELKDDFGSVTVDGKVYHLPSVTGAKVTLKSGYMDKYTWTLKINQGSVVENTIEKVAGSITDWEVDEEVDKPGTGEGGSGEEPEGTNLLLAAGWDTGAETAIGSWTSFAAWGSNGTVTNHTQVQKHGGNQSTLIEALPGKQFIGSYRGEAGKQLFIPLQGAATYHIGAWYYFTQKSSKSSLSVAIGAGTDAVYTNIPLEEVSLNQWVYLGIESTVKVSSANSELVLLANNMNAADQGFKFYIDDVTMKKIDGEDEGVNLLQSAGYNPSFEDIVLGQFTDLAWGGNFATSSYTMNNQASDLAHTGSKSVFFSLQNQGKGFAIAYRTPGNMQIPIQGIQSGKTYVVSFWINVKTHAGATSGGPGIGFDYTAAGHNADFTPAQHVTWVGPQDAAVGTWVQKTVEFTADTQQMDELILRCVNYGTGPFEFYLDDISLTLKE